MTIRIEVEHQGHALQRLEQSLDATNVISREFRGHVMSWAYKAVELAYHDGIAKGKEIGTKKREPEIDALRDFIGTLRMNREEFDRFLKIDSYTLEIKEGDK